MRFRAYPTTPERAAALSRSLGIHPVTAQILVSRGVEDAEQARTFLKPRLRDLHDGRRMLDMDRATERLETAIDRREDIAVYGDYDVDGVSATAVMVTMLQALGATVRPFLPNRFHDGYGLNGDALQRLRADGCSLVITVDNGTTRADEIAAARAAGLDIVVTDHHEPGARIPDCPVVNPKRSDETYPFTGLAGCGVAFKVGCALAERLGRMRDDAIKAALPDVLALVAIGTVADVVPLLDENRILVALGLKALESTDHPGLRALLSVSRCDGRKLRPRDVGFRVGPRINAAGRLGSADLAFDLLVCRDPGRAAELARDLDAGNRERQRIEKKQAEEAFAQAETAMAERDPPALVLYGPEWHPGVIGIIAARVAETYHRPTVLVTGEHEDGRGSARCFGETHLHLALEQCAPLLKTYGGHAKAAGFTIDPSVVSEFRERFEEAVAAQDHGGPAPFPVDAELPLDAISAPLAAEIASLEPFGAANAEPLFAAYGVRVAGSPRRTGIQEQHLSFVARGARSSVRAVAFGFAEHEELLADKIDIAYALRERTDGERYEIHVRQMAPADRESAPVSGSRSQRRT